MSTRKSLVSLAAMVACATTLVISIPQSAHARFIVGIDDGNDGSYEIIIVDDVDGPVGSATALGSSNTADANTAGGQISTGGLPISSGAFTLLAGVIAQSDPATGKVNVQLPVVSGIGTLAITVTDTFNPNPLNGIKAEISATGGTAAVSLDGSGTRDDGNGEFATVGPTYTTTIPAQVNPIAISMSNSSGSVTPYSLSGASILIHPTSTTSFGVSLTLTPVPEPSTLVLFGIGAMGLGTTFRRRRRR